MTNQHITQTCIDMIGSQLVDTLAHIEDLLGGPQPLTPDERRELLRLQNLIRAEVAR